MELLISPEDRGYPIEYILSRIRGRRSHLIPDWDPLLYESTPLDYLSTDRYRGFVTDRAPEAIWRELTREFRWVYVRMNRGLRKMFGPFFFYTELRTIFICLRQIPEKKAGRSEALLRVSLLSEELKKVLRQGEDTRSTVSGLEQLLCAFSERFRGLSGTWESNGLAGVERRIADTWLVLVMHSDLAGLIREFFLSLIDARNIIRLAKYLRLDIADDRSFIPGGRISAERLASLLDREDMAGILQLVRESSGMAAPGPSPSQIENTLYKGLSRSLRKSGRDPLGKGLILDYLWRCSIEAMNLGIIFYGRDIDRETVAGELVR